ncbi:MAG: MFS transporter [Acidiferrobacteraceae bacterium]
MRTIKRLGINGSARDMMLWTLCLGVLIVQVDTSVANLAVHAIGVSLHASLRTLQWTIDGYNLVYASLLMSGGTLSDLFGRRRTLQVGVGLFTLGSAVSGLAPSPGVLIAGRVISGIGAALLLPSTLALIRVIWTDPRERAHAVGVWAGMNGAAFALGPTLGGFLISIAGWRSVFLLIIPFGLIMGWLVKRTLPEPVEHVSTHRRLDLPGQMLAGLGLAGLTLAVIERGHLAGVSAMLGAISVLGFLWVERRAGESAMIPLTLLRTRALTGAIAIAASMTFGMYGMLFLLPLIWLQSGALTVTHAGLALLPMSLAYLALSHRSGAMSHRLGTRPMMAGGMTLIGGGLLTLSVTHAGQPFATAEMGLLLTGVGMALSTGPLLGVAVTAVTSSRAGTASGLVNTARMVGATLGVAVSGVVYAEGVTPAHGFALAMRVGATVVFGGALLATCL